MGDAKDWLIEGFGQGVSALPDELLRDLMVETAHDYGMRAARVAIAPVVWANAVGERMDTSQACEFLGVSRQALSKRVHGGSLVGLRGRGTTYYPTWQFDLERGEVWPVVRHIIGAFIEEIGGPDPYMIAAWATTPQTEDLGGVTPAEWISKGAEDQPLIEAARRAAGRLSA